MTHFSTHIKELNDLRLYLHDRLKVEEKVLTDAFAKELGLEDEDGLFVSMFITEIGDKKNKGLISSNPFKSLFVKRFFEKSKLEPSFYNDINKELFYNLQRGYVMYQLEKIKVKEELEEFRDMLYEARFIFTDPFVDDDFLYEINEIIEDLP